MVNRNFSNGGGGGAFHSMEDSRGAREKTSDKKTVSLYNTRSATVP